MLNLHNAHPPKSTSGVLTIRMHRLVICSMGSTPATLPAATALALHSTDFSVWNTFWQYLQYQVPLGIRGRGTHSANGQNN